MDKIQIASERGYFVTKDGLVFFNGKQRKLNLKNKKYQYYCFNIRIDGKPKRIEVHRLQAYQKFGDKIFEKGIVVRHLNGDSTDNSYDNIGIGTYQDNSLDIPKDVRVKLATYAGSFVKKYDYEIIYAFYLKTKSYKQTMEKFGIPSKNGLHHILKSFK